MGNRSATTSGTGAGTVAGAGGEGTRPVTVVVEEQETGIAQEPAQVLEAEEGEIGTLPEPGRGTGDRA